MAIGEGDEIVLSIMEHHSNIVPWHFHRERKGAVLKWVAGRRRRQLPDLDAFEKLLDATDTKIVAITHMSNVLGTVDADQGDRRASPMRAASRCWSTAARARCTCRSTCSDLDVDFYVFTGHKLYGPTGIGVLYGKRERLDADAALSGRRRDDPRRDRGRRHL